MIEEAIEDVEEEEPEDIPQDLEIAAKNFEENLPECLTNSDIKTYGYSTIDAMHDILKQQEENLDISDLMQLIEQAQASVKAGKEIDPQQFRAIVQGVAALQSQKVDEWSQNPDASI